MYASLHGTVAVSTGELELAHWPQEQKTRNGGLTDSALRVPGVEKSWVVVVASSGSDTACLMEVCMALGSLLANGRLSGCEFRGLGSQVCGLWVVQEVTRRVRCRYALMLVCMALGALLANGATGPLAALTTLLLPPEFKSFALSVYEFLTGLLGPMYSVIVGVGLQVSAPYLFFWFINTFSLVSTSTSALTTPFHGVSIGVQKGQWHHQDAVLPPTIFRT